MPFIYVFFVSQEIYKKKVIFNLCHKQHNYTCISDIGEIVVINSAGGDYMICCQSIMFYVCVIMKSLNY